MLPQNNVHKDINKITNFTYCESFGILYNRIFNRNKVINTRLGKIIYIIFLAFTGILFY